MAEDIKYGIIREVGEYAEVKELSEKDNKTVNEQDRNKPK